MDAASFLADIDDKRQLLTHVHGVDPDGLGREQDIDRRFLIGILESDIRLAEARRLWEIDPAIYVPSRRIAQLLEQVASESAGTYCVELTELLDGVPRDTQFARDNLRRPPRRFTDDAIFQVGRTLAAISDSAATTIERGCAATDATETVASAVAALEDYLGFLEDDLLQRSDGDWAIGDDAYNYILKKRWFLDADAGEILARGEIAFAETEVLAQEVAERIEPGNHWTEVYERLKDDQPAADGLKQAYQQQMDAARDFVIEHRILTLPEGERVITVDTPPAMRRSSPFGTFQTVGPFEDGLEGRLVLTPVEDWMTPAQQAERLRSHHSAWIPIIAVHEAYPGHHAQALKRNENRRVLRRVAAEPVFSEGWGLYTEALMFELGFLRGDDVKLTQLRNRLWRAARVILDVSMNTGRMEFDEAVEFLVERVRFERYAAELEVGMYPRRPAYYTGYLIGMQEIASIHADYVREFGEPEPPSEFFDALLRTGALPPALVRESLFATRREAGAP